MFLVFITSKKSQFSDVDCEPVGGLDNITRYQQVLEELQQYNNVTSVWLPVKRLKFKYWTWLDGSLHGKRFTDNSPLLI